MTPEELSVPVVRDLVTALRDGDRETFYAAFTDDAVLTDEGAPQPLRAWAERELFAPHGTFEPEREENGGLRLLGQYRSDHWETRVYWNVELRDDKVARLDLGPLR